ncbi:MAG: hypothetical protein BYD32DRAFT_465506 [Podila humilis]|nr:MAG: hypothetical protein BYD32DRAFT_465506 [Podila humilis]
MADLQDEQEATKKIGRQKWVAVMAAALLASPAFALIPQQSRQLTLALYFLTQTIHAFVHHGDCFPGMWRRLVKAGYVKNIRHGGMLLFGLPTGVIMAVFETMPTLQRKLQLN